MSSVWYIRSGVRRRTISVEDWAKLGVTATEDSHWDYENGWSLPESDFNSQQLAYLDADVEFLTGQSDGPRVFPSPAPIYKNDNPVSAYAYYKALKDSFESSDKSLSRATRGTQAPRSPV